MRRRFVVTLTIMLAMALALVGCGNGGVSGDPNLGRYEGYAITIFNTNEPIEDTYDEGENYVELKAEGKAVVCLDGNPLQSTYTLDGDKITLVINEEDGNYNSEGTLKDGVLTFNFLGLGLDLTFVKDGVDKPFEVTSTKPTDTTAEGGSGTEDSSNTDASADASAGTGDSANTDANADASASAGTETATSGSEAESSNSSGN